MGQKIVVCVLANKPLAVQGLIDVLDDRFSVIIHMDAKVDLSKYDLRLPPHCSMLQERHAVFWGGFNMCRAMVAMIDAAYQTVPTFERIVMVTGDTLPTVGLDFLEAALLDASKEYIHMSELPDDPTLRGIHVEESKRRHGSVHPWRFQNFVYSDDELQSGRSREETMRKFGIPENRVDYVRGSVHRIARELLARMPPRPPLYEKPFTGASWWALSRQALNLIIDEMHAPSHQEFFRYLEVPDEHFFQTLLGNKHRALQSMGKTATGPLVYVDYANPARAEFKGKDFLPLDGFRETYAKHGKMFARKYDPEQSPDIAAAIEGGCYFTDVVPTS